eukprot:Seg11109.2 transcript_id=Seg11109.2/GoldUCD/mRNA.D3Y31 product="hypothetical protein" protein_id=Seg11109.2/GoldUCD/D3Y31
MLEQNYSSHMKNIHNSNETRDASQMPITFTFQPKPNKAPRLETVDVDLEQQKSDEQDTASASLSFQDEELLELVADETEGEVLPNEEYFPEQCSSASTNIPNVSPGPLQQEKELKNEVASLKADVHEMKESIELRRSRNEKRRSVVLPHETVAPFDDESLLRRCRSIEGVLKYFPELELVEEELKIVCRFCIPEKELPATSGNALPSGLFLINESMDGDSDILSSAFRNLKISISCHLKRDSHQQAISQDEALNIKAEKEAKRNNTIALHIGSACYNLYHRGRPYTDLEDELLLLHKCEVDIGDINHSHEFAHNYLESVAEVVKGNIQQFLKRILLQTGFLPPVKVLADKATFKHRTRQFVGMTSVIPDADDLIQYIYLGSPVVKKHNGQGVGQSIISVLKEFEITAEQFQGGSFYGQYFHLCVPKVLNTYFGKNEEDESVHYDYDPMHKAGLVDTHIRKSESFRNLDRYNRCCWRRFQAF